MSALVRRASWRYFQRRPWQLSLAVLGVALGVAVVVAVDAATASAERAFELSNETVVGRATHQVVGGPGGISEALYARLRVETGLRAAAPVVEAYGKINDETVHLLGIDPLAEAAVRAPVAGITSDITRRLLLEPATVVLADVTAQRLALQPGDRFTIDLGGRRHELLLIGLIVTDASTRASLDGLMLTDIASAQELLDTTGRLSWIDLSLPENEPGVQLQQRVKALLPPGAELIPAAARSRSMLQMARAFHTNLIAMSLLALLVGMFLIYNTMSFAVLQRRQLLGMLRVAGATRAEIFRVIATEGMIIAVVGSVLGLLAGFALAHGLTRLVTRTINDLYFVVTVTEFTPTLAPLLKTFVAGLVASAVAILAPAGEAGATTPARATLERRARTRAPQLAIAGVVLIALAAAGLALPTRDLVWALAAILLLLLGMAFVAPLAIAWLARMPAPPGTIARLALRGIGASLSRTGIAIVALMLAVATTVGVGVMIASFRDSVIVWLESTLQADIYVTAPSLRTQRTLNHLDARFIERVRALAGIERITSARAVTVESGTGFTPVFALDAPRSYEFPLLEGDRKAAFDAFYASAAVLVSEPYAYYHGFTVGDRVELRTDRGQRAFAIAGVYRDYNSDSGEVLMFRALYDVNFKDRHVTSLGVYLQPGVDIADMLTRVRAAIGAGEPEVLIRSNRDLRETSLAIFDRTFTITHVLRLLAVVVAIVGILSALMALALERTRELGTLRALGFTPGGIFGLVTLQSGLMGAIAGVLALPVGAVLAALLIHVVNRRAFGWTIDMQWPPGVFVEAVALAVIAALVAGLYPGLRMSRANPARMLREE